MRLVWVTALLLWNVAVHSSFSWHPIQLALDQLALKELMVHWEYQQEYQQA